MTRSDECIEIANDIRELARHGVPVSHVMRVMGLETDDFHYDPTLTRDGANRLANIVDPTATAVVCGNADPSRGRVDAFAVCSECDSVIGPLTGTGPVLLARYCPHCGARISMLRHD